jgi:hypothetical protein
MADVESIKLPKRLQRYADNLTAASLFDTRWCVEAPETSENISDSSLYRWTSKVPVVSAVLSNPSAYAALRRALHTHWDSQVPGDVLADLEPLKHPKMPDRFVDGLNIIPSL